VRRECSPRAANRAALAGIPDSSLFVSRGNGYLQTIFQGLSPGDGNFCHHPRQVGLRAHPVRRGEATGTGFTLGGQSGEGVERSWFGRGIVPPRCCRVGRIAENLSQERLAGSRSPGGRSCGPRIRVEPVADATSGVLTRGADMRGRAVAKAPHPPGITVEGAAARSRKTTPLDFSTTGSSRMTDGGTSL